MDDLANSSNVDKDNKDEIKAEKAEELDNGIEPEQAMKAIFVLSYLQNNPSHRVIAARGAR